MRKEILFSLKFDDSSFNSAVSNIQKKLKDIYTPSDQMRAQADIAQKLKQVGMGGMVSAPNQEAFKRATQQSRKELDSLIKEQAQGYERINKNLAEMMNKRSSMTEGSKKELEITKEINKQIQNSINLYGQLNALANAKEKSGPQGMGRIMEAYKNGGLSGAATAAHRIIDQNHGGIMNAMGGGLASMGGGLASMGTLAERYTGYGQRLEAARGSAIQGTTGQDLQGLYSQAPLEAAFLPERRQAAGLAEQKEGRNRVTDRMKGIGGLGLIAGGAVGAGLSIAGTPFTMGGSALGLTGSLGMMGAGVGMLSNDRNRQGIFGGKEYEQLLAGQKAKDFRSTLQDLKEQDPEKYQGVENFHRDYQRNVGAQRTLGLNNKGFYGEGGFLAKGAAQGFGPEQMIGMGQSIVGAGGSARQGQQAGLGLQMQRMGMTNASSILGTLGGGAGSTDSNKRAVISIISEAFKIGLDNTDFAEENRKFTQAAAGIISRTGATGEGDQDRISQTLGQFLGQRSNAGVDAAKGAYERFQERGSQVGGRRGAMRFASAMQDKNLSKLPTDEMAELLNMKPEELNENSDVVQYFANKAGLTPKELIANVKGINKNTRFQIPGNEKKAMGFASKVNDYMKKEGISRGELDERRKAGKLPSDVAQAMGGLKVATNIEEGGGITDLQSSAAVGEFLEPGATAGKSKEQVAKELGATGGKVEDLWTKALAEGADEARKKFEDLVPIIQKATTSISELADAVSPAATALRKDAEQRRKNAPSADPFLGTTTKAMVQPQATKDRK